MRRPPSGLVLSFSDLPAARLRSGDKGITRGERAALLRCHGCGSRVKPRRVTVPDRRVVRSGQPAAMAACVLSLLRPDRLVPPEALYAPRAAPRPLGRVGRSIGLLLVSMRWVVQVRLDRCLRASQPVGDLRDRHLLAIVSSKRRGAPTLTNPITHLTPPRAALRPSLLVPSAQRRTVSDVLDSHSGHKKGCRLQPFCSW